MLGGSYTKHGDRNISPVHCHLSVHTAPGMEPPWHFHVIFKKRRKTNHAYTSSCSIKRAVWNISKVSSTSVRTS